MKLANGILGLVVIVGTVVLAVDCTGASSDKLCRDLAAKEQKDVSHVGPMLIAISSQKETCSSFCSSIFRDYSFEYTEPYSICAALLLRKQRWSYRSTCRTAKQAPHDALEDPELSWTKMLSVRGRHWLGCCRCDCGWEIMYQPRPGVGCSQTCANSFYGFSFDYSEPKSCCCGNKQWIFANEIQISLDN